MHAAESALNLTHIELERAQKLVAEKVFPQSGLDTAQDKVRQAEEFLKASKAELAAGMTGRSEDIEKLESEMKSIQKQVEVAQLNLEKVNEELTVSSIFHKIQHPQNSKFFCIFLWNCI